MTILQHRISVIFRYNKFLNRSCLPFVVHLNCNLQLAVDYYNEFPSDRNGLGLDQADNQFPVEKRNPVSCLIPSLINRGNRRFRCDREDTRRTNQKKQPTMILFATFMQSRASASAVHKKDLDKRRKKKRSYETNCPVVNYKGKKNKQF